MFAVKFIWSIAPYFSKSIESFPQRSVGCVLGPFLRSIVASKAPYIFSIFFLGGGTFYGFFLFTIVGKDQTKQI